MRRDILELLNDKWEDGNRPKDLYADLILSNPAAYLDDIVSGLGLENKRVRNGCAELASLLSADHPRLLYRHFGLFSENLAAKVPVLKWEAACTIGNLAVVDKAGRISPLIPVLASLLSDKSIVLQGHAARALAKIATAFPAEATTIFRKLHDANDKFPGNRIGVIIESMAPFVRHPRLRKKVREFVLPHGESDIKAVAKKANKILKMIDNTDSK